ncbi:hypothetical protein DRE_01428 [Drechslerella stenobrocha 248]|uniref:Uncharacterized protein n=1 Tax=Drechslerella stenobrocha 248 TaxID=1043628 RepID=W7HI54_9PEZI|nr:hypothetical protein DRE_01428 [Drechslerella stenobrocha 248]
MVKPLHFKGDKKPLKKRKRADEDEQSASTTLSASTAEKFGNTTSTSSAAGTVTQPTRAESGKQRKTLDEGLDADDGWVNSDILDDIKGPVIFAFASAPPTCLACDANGKVFASVLRDVDGEDLSTAEPHDVRQVWTPTRVPSSTKFAFKGHHGRYLACDKIGLLSATRDAIGPEEEFVPVHTETGWGVQTCRDKFLSAEEKNLSKGGGGMVEIRGDAETIGFGETWVIRGQKRFKTKVRREGDKEERISRRELEALAGQPLDDDQVKLLKKARREGNLQSALLDIRQKKKRDKFAWNATCRRPKSPSPSDPSSRALFPLSDPINLSAGTVSPICPPVRPDQLPAIQHHLPRRNPSKLNPATAWELPDWPAFLKESSTTTLNITANVTAGHPCAHYCDNAKSLEQATRQRACRGADTNQPILSRTSSKVAGNTKPRHQQRLARITLPHNRPRMQDDVLMIPRRDLLVPKPLINGATVLDTSDDEGIFTPGPEYSSAATSLGMMSKKSSFPISRPTTPKPSSAATTTNSANASPVAPLPSHSSAADRERERDRKRKREQTPIDDAVHLQIQAEHKERDARLTDRQTTKSPSPASLAVRPIIKRSPKKASVRFSADVRGPMLPAAQIISSHRRKNSTETSTQNDTTLVESESDTLEEEKTETRQSASPPRAKRQRTAKKRGVPTSSTMVTAGAFAFIGLLGAKFLAPDSAESKLQTLCNLPGMQGITENLPFCPTGVSIRSRGAFMYGKGDKAPPDYKRLMELQFSFEKILEDSVGGSRLAYDMKTSEMAVRDLTTLVKVSGLACREQLSIHLEQFGDTARVASRSLSRFSSRVMGTIDSILALDQWAKKTLEDIRDSETASKMSITSLVLWPNSNQIRKDISNTFLKTTEGMDKQLQRLVMEAQGVLAILDQLEDRLNTIHEIISREANHIKIENDEVLSAILTKLGANKQKIARNREHVKLLNNVSHYRKTALSHVSATVVELERMSADLEQLRETVAAPSLLDGVVEAPIELHIRNIDQGIMRLTAGRIKASSRKEEYHQAVMAGIDYQNKLINAQIAEIASKPLVHNVDI